MTGSDAGETETTLLVIGGSAGSLIPLIELVATLPPDLPAAVLVCQHIGEDARSRLPAILDRRSALPAATAEHGETPRPGRIYVAPPGHHLLVTGRRLHLSGTGPRVNRHRPSIDVLLASVAESTGPHAIAVVLSGVLDDGAVGAALVEQAGGQVWVQDPERAEFPGMPQAVLAAVPDARVLSGDPRDRALIDAVVRIPVRSVERPEVARPEVPEVAEDSHDPGFLQPGESRLTRLSCPDCGGGLAQIDLPRISYFRCHVGHQYGPQTLAAAQNEASEQKLWGALAAIEEQAVVSNYLAQLSDGSGAQAGVGARRGQVLSDRAAELRALIHGWTVPVDHSAVGD